MLLLMELMLLVILAVQILLRVVLHIFAALAGSRSSRGMSFLLAVAPVIVRSRRARTMPTRRFPA